MFVGVWGPMKELELHPQVSNINRFVRSNKG